MSRPARADDIDEICWRCPRSSSAPRGATVRRTRCRGKGKGSCSTGCRTRPRSTRRPGRCTTTCSSSPRPTRGREAGPGRGRAAAVLHHRPLQRLHRRAGPAVPARRDRAARSWPRSSPTPGPPRRPKTPGRGSSSRMADPRPRGRSPGAVSPAPARPSTRLVSPRSTSSRRSGSTAPTPTSCCPAVLRQHGLSGRDAAFVTELASGTIRRRGTYDAILAACVDRPLSKVEAKVLDALRLGTHQLLSMRVPVARGDQHHRRPGPRAKVELRRRRLRQRRAAAGGRAGPRRSGSAGSPPTRGSAPTRYASIAYSHPRWVVDELPRARSVPTSSTTCSPPTTSPRGSPWWPGRAARRATSCRASRPATRRTAWCLAGGDPGAVPAVAEGRAGVQDEGSQLVALALARRRDRGSRRAAGSTCAPGPGGKAALLAALAAERGRRLVGAERQPHRAELVQRALRGADGVVGRGRRRRDARRRGRPAPSTGCSSTRRAPASARCAADPRRGGGGSPTTCSRWSCSSDGCSPRPSSSVRPGGVVLYATCSPVLAETTRASSPRCSTTRPACDLEDVGAAAARRTRLRRAGARHRPAVAAPARHRRDVPGAAAQGVSSGQSSRTWRR